ncbi:hypothetical protein N7448_003875 [Penicillium atrosanguineum]|nr:hypothetical protein N7448_003875 [Penicillium atrosanguineum]
MSNTKYAPEIDDAKPPCSDTPYKPAEEWPARPAERAYYQRDNVFMKRSLRPSEFITNLEGTVHIPRRAKELLQNEAASLRFVRNAGIPVPTVYGAFEVNDSFFLITEYIERISMRDLTDDQKEVVRAEIDQHLAMLRGLRSCELGGPSGIVLPPYRVMECTDKDAWSLRPSGSDEYVFCHNYLTHSNINVDPVSLLGSMLVSYLISSKGISTSGLEPGPPCQWL